jgi:hypothetical protein
MASDTVHGPQCSSAHVFCLFFLSSFFFCSCCRDVADFLSEHDKNVSIIHVRDDTSNCDGCARALAAGALQAPDPGTGDRHSHLSIVFAYWPFFCLHCALTFLSFFFLLFFSVQSRQGPHGSADHHLPPLLRSVAI